MLNDILANFYERDLGRLMEEIKLFSGEQNIWRTHGAVKNSAGNLALHIIGGMNYLIGARLGHTGFVRHRELEFTRKDVPRTELIKQLGELIPLVSGIMRTLDMNADYPVDFDDAKRSNSYVMVQLSLHLNYHLGQVNYLRRVLED